MVQRAAIRHGALVLSLRIALASAWGGLLALSGLWALTKGTSRFPALSHVWITAGLTAFAMGQFVFARLVADRLFPGASARLAGGSELLMAIVYVGGFLSLISLTLGALS